MWENDSDSFLLRVDMAMLDLERMLCEQKIEHAPKAEGVTQTPSCAVGKTAPEAGGDEKNAARAADARSADKPSADSRGGGGNGEKNTEDAVNLGEIPRKDGGLPRIISLASGSRANCTLVDGGSTRILIDFGLSCRMLSGFLKELGLTINDITAVFITHEHSDHVSGLTTFFKKYSIPVHMTEPSFLAYTRGRGFENRDKITVHPVEYKVDIGGFTVSSCEICHDSAACVSYLVEGEGVSFCTCTDLGYMPKRVLDHVSRAENVILESNHDVELLRDGAYTPELKHRIRSRHGHLSNAQCAEVLVELSRRGVKRVLLGHVSPENNDPEIALREAREALLREGSALEYLDIAPRLEPKRLV